MMAVTGFAERLRRFERDLVELGRDLIPRSPTATDQWLADPDGVDEHKPEWHQWGIVTHSRLFVDYLQTQVPDAFRRVSPVIAETLFERQQLMVDGLSRGQLMLVAGLWHDLGKFATRTRSRRSGWSFIGHARVSGAVIRDWLGEREGFTPEQIELMGRLADLHFAPMELKLAMMSRKKPVDASVLYQQIALELGDLGYEIMAFYWADTLAKGSTPRQELEQPLLWQVFEQGLLAVDALAVSSVSE